MNGGGAGGLEKRSRVLDTVHIHVICLWKPRAEEKLRPSHHVLSHAFLLVLRVTAAMWPVATPGPLS